MERKPGMLTFEEWVEYAFNRPVAEPQWYCQHEHGQALDWWQPEPTVLAIYLAQLFEHAAFLMDCYSPEQLNQAFWFIAGSGSGYFHIARLHGIPVEMQQRWVRAIFPLYRDLFARICSPHLGHLNEGPANPLNSACYMFWDMDCLEGAAMYRGSEHLVGPIFEVLEKILTLPSIACQESALHGLAHLAPYHQKRVARIVDAYLAAPPLAGIPGKLHRYAESARIGAVQ